MYCNEFYKIGIFHCDIKPQNIILKRKDNTNHIFQYKFIDLGSACKVNEFEMNYAKSRTVAYMLPKIL